MLKSEDGNLVSRTTEDKELQAREKARGILMDRGKEAWRIGDTRTAFGNFEAAGTPSVTFVRLAGELEEADKIFQEWKATVDPIEKAMGGHATGHILSIGKSSALPCRVCDAVKEITQNAAFGMATKLGWTMYEYECINVMLNVADTFYQNAATAAYRAAARRR